MKVELSPKKNARIEMLPLIDIVFLVLVVFIYSMLSMSVHHGMPVTLPESDTAETETETVLSVTVKNKDEIYVNHEQVSLAQLAGYLENMPEDAGSSGVLLFARKNLPCQVLFNVLDEIKLAGHTRISLQARLKDVQGKE
ncbi:MAG: ExbD/TolR family protein [Thermodesulfobacteriota bacterium]